MRLRDESGFTLLEVIIASALMLGVALSMLEINKVQQKGILANEALSETVSSVLQIYAYLRDVRSCNATIGAAIGPVRNEAELYSKPERPIGAIYRRVKRSDGTWESVPVIETGAMMGDGAIKINALRLRMPTNDKETVFLLVDFERVKMKMPTTKMFPIPYELVEPNEAYGVPVPEGSEKKQKKFLVGCMGTSELTTLKVDDLGYDVSKFPDDYDSSWARESTLRILREACKATGGKWIEKEKRCGVAALE
jgi:hypothetical protein